MRKNDENERRKKSAVRVGVDSSLVLISQLGKEREGAVAPSRLPLNIRSLPVNLFSC